jgi:hypothetical protein
MLTINDAACSWRVTRNSLSGLIGSGDAVIADAQAEILTYLASFNDKILAVDMEAGGLSLTCYEHSVITGRPCGWVVIRGISDTADPRKNDNSHRIASWHATVALRHLRPAQAAGAVTDASHSIAVTGMFNAHYARARLSCHPEPIRAAQCQLQVPRTTVR